MTQEKYLAALSELFDNALVLTKAKSTDYSGPNDAFANFQLIETLTQGKITAEMGIVVRMSDKLQRISNLLLSGKAEVKDERVADTCKDLMIYAAILHIMTQETSILDQISADIKEAPKSNYAVYGLPKQGPFIGKNNTIMTNTIHGEPV